MTMSGIVEQVLKTTDIVGGGLFKSFLDYRPMPSMGELQNIQAPFFILYSDMV